MSKVKKSYDFKSVGQLQTTLEEMAVNTEVIMPIGITTPISFAPISTSMFAMSTDIGTQIKDNLRNLLSTDHGERLMLGDFGANLKELAYDVSSEDVIPEVLARISTAVSKYMPFVELNTMEPRIEKSPDGEVLLSIIRLTYDVPSAAVSNQVVEVALVVVD